MIDFSTRSTTEELMDQPDVRQEEVEKALRELEIINLRLGGFAVSMSALKRLKLTGKFHIVDYGCGGGDVLRYLYDHRDKNSEPEFSGIDINPFMIDYCRARNGDRKIHFYKYSIWDKELAALPCDIVINSLFCHHFDDKELIALVSKMYAHASKAVIINDLHRHPLAYHSIKFITRLFSKSYLVKNDGPLSVARSLTRSEWETILQKAGITDYSIRWCWAFRWQIILFKR